MLALLNQKNWHHAGYKMREANSNWMKKETIVPGQDSLSERKKKLGNWRCFQTGVEINAKEMGSYRQCSMQDLSTLRQYSTCQLLSNQDISGDCLIFVLCWPISSSNYICHMTKLLNIFHTQHRIVILLLLRLVG